MRDHTKLGAFELAGEVTVLIYRATRAFPREELHVDSDDALGLTAFSLQPKQPE